MSFVIDFFLHSANEKVIATKKATKINKPSAALKPDISKVKIKATEKANEH
jgi:hypothetical protein